MWFESEEDRAAFAAALEDEHLATDTPELAELTEQQLDAVIRADARSSLP